MGLILPDDNYLKDTILKGTRRHICYRATKSVKRYSGMTYVVQMFKKY